MKSVSFSIARVDRLRRAAERARDLSDEHRGPSPEGWFASAYDANDLIRVFDTLRLKAGFALHAYALNEGTGGNGIIWAVPNEPSLVAPEERPDLAVMWLDPPKPPGAVPLMQAIEGDGSPWSYLSASILRREAAEFGAFWHGCEWSPQRILSKPPRQADDQDVPVHDGDRSGDAPASDWKWRGPVPKTWEPTYVERDSTKRVVLHIYNPVGEEQIYRATDTYRADSYDCTTRTRVLCTGSGGFIY